MSLVFAQKNLTNDDGGADAVVEILCSSLSSVAIQLAGTFSATVDFEATVDASNWVALSLTPSAGGSAVDSATGEGIWAGNCGGYMAVRANCSTYGSGVVSAAIGASDVAAPSPAGDDTQLQFNDGGVLSGTPLLTYTANDELTFADGAEIAMGAAPAAAGDIRLSNEGVISSRNAADDGDITLIYLEDDATWIGDGWVDINSDTGVATLWGGAVIANGKAIRTNTTTAHTALLQAYDVNGTTYRTFLTLTNGDVPSCTISQPAGGTLVFIPPTADPLVVGALWNNAGTLTISAG